MAEFFGMHEQPGSGTLFGNGKYEYIFKGLRGTGAANFELLRRWAQTATPFRGQYIEFAGCKLSSDQSLDTLYITTAPSPERISSLPVEHAEGERVFALEITDLEKPLEMHPDYRANWNYDLFAALEATDENMTNPVLPELPAWWETATDLNITPADQFNYKWGKTTPADQTIKSGGQSKVFRWLLLKKRTMPGVEAYPYAAPTVVERIYFRSESKANANLRRANTHAAPGKTYIYEKDPAHWIVKPSGIEENNNYYITVNRYIYADKWEERIYPNA